MQRLSAHTGALAAGAFEQRDELPPEMAYATLDRHQEANYTSVNEELGHYREQARREVLEETGWAIAEPLLVGLLHFTHLTPKPSGYTYPYPDFVQVVYMANAVTFVPEAKLDDGYEVESMFCSIDDLPSLTLPVSQRLFLDVAIQVRASLPE